jgi:hypothetical protein
MNRPAIALLLLLVAPQAFAAELADYVGEWTGKGTYSEKGSSESSGRLTCRLGITSPKSDVIVIAGRCAAPEGSRGFKTQVTKTGPGSIAGLELSVTKPRTSSGRLNNGGLRLDGSDAEGTFFFQLSSPASGSMEMRSSSTTTWKTEAAQVQLKRAK